MNNDQNVLNEAAEDNFQNLNNRNYSENNIAIHIESDYDTTDGGELIRSPQRAQSSTNIVNNNMDSQSTLAATPINSPNHHRPRSGESNLLTIINNNLRRQRPYAGETQQQHHRQIQQQHSISGAMREHNNQEEVVTPDRSSRFWRMHLNDVLSLSTVRSFITHSSSFRYSPLNVNDTDLETVLATRARPLDIEDMRLINNQNSGGGVVMGTLNTPLRLNSRTPIGRSISERDDDQSQSGFHTPENNQQRLQVLRVGAHRLHHQPGPNSANRIRVRENDNVRNNNIDNIEDENAIIFSQIFDHFLRYVPFICILAMKFMHDHLLGILDLLALHLVLYNANKSLRKQVGKLSQKNNILLLRDFVIIVVVVSYRLILSSAPADPLGLLIQIPMERKDIEPPKEATVAAQIDEKIIQNPEINITTAIPLGTLIYFVAVNDVILKLFTLLIKIVFTLLPITFIRIKTRARLFGLLEYISQFYRSLVPMRQWLTFLFESYAGLEIISGVLFSSFYIGAKGFELIDRGKYLKKAIVNFIQKSDSERKPTKEEIESAGALCPICHESFNSPIILECGHIFCDVCVSTWFKREQTCPMCRAKVNDDPAWQDGSTTHFLQLF